MDLFDRYAVIQALGAGAAGGVFLVEDRLWPGSRLALKRIGARPDDLLRASFEREFAVLAGLSLPGVTRVFDFGVADSHGDHPGGPFFTRSYVEGDPLDLAADGLSLGERMALFGRLCSVVAPLHRIGLAHGDLKPRNVIVDGQGNPHVIDFGLARVSAAADAPGSVGTRGFMAPEVLRGGPVSVAADIYALGCTLWTLATGKGPYSELGERAIAACLAGEAPTAPEGQDERTREVLEIALRALAFDPTRRTPTVDELAASLPSDADGDAPPMRLFVPPRPQGHEDVLAQLDARVAARRDSHEAAPLLLRATRGGGKSTLLCELKWRLQLRGVRVVELACRAGAGLSPLRSLERQVAVFLGSEGGGRRN